MRQSESDNDASQLGNPDLQLQRGAQEKTCGEGRHGSGGALGDPVPLKRRRSWQLRIILSNTQ